MQCIIVKYAEASRDYILIAGLFGDEAVSFYDKNLGLCYDGPHAKVHQAYFSECQSLYDKYKLLVSNAVMQEPQFADVVYCGCSTCNVLMSYPSQYGESVVFLPLRIFTRDSLTTIGACVDFFVCGLEDIVLPRMHQRLAEL